MAEATGWIPVLKVADATRSIAFYCELLGFQKRWEHRFEEGWPLYACVQRGPLLLHISEHKGGGTERAELYCIVPDVDALYEEFRKNGVTIGDPPTDQDWGMREFGIADLDGHHMGFASPIAKQPG